MKAELSKVRQTYSVKYQEFINKIQGHADEVIRVFSYNIHHFSLTHLFIQIMSLYEEIVRERAAKGPDYRNGLLALEASRNYQV